MGGGLATQRLGDAEAARRAAVGVAVVDAVVVANAGLGAQRAEQRVVKLLGDFNIADAKHDVAEHGFGNFRFAEDSDRKTVKSLRTFYFEKFAESRYKIPVGFRAV